MKSIKTKLLSGNSSPFRAQKAKVAEMYSTSKMINRNGEESKFILSFLFIYINIISNDIEKIFVS